MDIYRGQICLLIYWENIHDNFMYKLAMIAIIIMKEMWPDRQGEISQDSEQQNGPDCLRAICSL